MKISTTIFRQITLVVFLFFAFSLSLFGAGETAALSFASTAQRTFFSTSKQVWEQNGIKLTNDKGSSTSNVADYANPARFYKSSKITIEAPGNIKTIVFTCSSSSYATALKNSITTATPVISGSKVSIALSDESPSYTITSLSGGQVRLTEIVVTYEVEQSCIDPTISFASTAITKINGDANFTNTLTTNSDGEITYSSSATNVATVNATTGEVSIKGVGTTTITASIAATSTHCEASASYELIVTYPVEEYMITFGNSEPIETENRKIVNIPDLPEMCNASYSTKVGWTTEASFGVSPAELVLIDENTQFTQNTQLYPVYSKEVEGKGEAWVLVTDVSMLTVGNQVVIAAKDYNYALSTNQKDNNRGATSIIKNGDNIILGTDVQVLDLQQGKSEGTFALYTGSGYLYASSSSSNQLKTKDDCDATSSWKITIANDSTATIVAQGTNTRKTMQYNPNNGNPLFACYEKASQKSLSIYKKVLVPITKPEYFICSDLIVESNTTFNVEDDLNINNLTIKSNLDQAGQLNTTNASITAGNITIEKTIDASRYFFFSLPFNCNITDIEAFDVTAPTTPLEYYDDYTIFYYDQKKASDNKGVAGSKAWVEITDTNTTLKANQGYIVGYLVNEGTATIKFKSTQAQTIATPTTAQLNFGDYTWYTAGERATANGWNLIGMPYYTKPANATLSCDSAYTYSTTPNQDGETYTQTTFADANISPFTSFFVQLARNEAPTFSIVAQQSAAPMFRNKGAIRKVVISLSDANGGVDNTTIIDNPNTTTDYEIGHDLAKWLGYATIPQIYSIQGDDILAFNSLAMDNSTVIPLGVYAHADGEYTFALDEKSVGDLQGWELYDNEVGATVRLVDNSYGVYLEKGTHEGRFELRLQQRIATDCGNTMGSVEVWTENGTLNMNNMPTDAVVYVYDAVGRMVDVINPNSQSFSYDFVVRGVYNIVISSPMETIIFKTIY